MDEGTQFGPYEVIKRIGVGGMAEIFLARTQGIGGFEKFLALKFIHSKFAEDEDFIELLIDEAKIAVQLTHPNVGQIFDLGCIDGHYYIAMEFIDGKDLYQIQLTCADTETPLPFDVAAYVGMNISGGLHYAHAKADNYGRPLNIIHRDVSPQNILLSYDGQVKLVDFGIAKANERKRQTESGVIKGKFFWMSPEQAWGEVLDARSDIFSVGVCLFEMVCGELLYNEERALVLLDKVRRAVIPDIQEKRPDTPTDLVRIILKSLAREPEDRYQTAGELQGALTGFLYSVNPGFNAATLGQFVASVLGDNRFTLPIPEPEIAKPKKAKGHMDAQDYDNTRSHSVLFDVAAHDAKQARVEEDEEEDHTVASIMSVAPMRLSYLDDDPESSGQDFCDDGDRTALLDTSFISDVADGADDVQEDEVDGSTNISVPPQDMDRDGPSLSGAQRRRGLPEVGVPQNSGPVRRVTLPPARAGEEETMTLSDLDRANLAPQPSRSGQRDRGGAGGPSTRPPGAAGAVKQSKPETTPTQPGTMSPSAAVQAEAQAKAQAKAPKKKVPEQAAAPGAGAPEPVKVKPKGKATTKPKGAKPGTPKKSPPAKAAGAAVTVQRGGGSATRKPSFEERFATFREWALTPAGITVNVLFLLFLYLVAAGLPFLMRSTPAPQVSLKLLSLPTGAKVFLDGKGTQRKTDTTFADLSPDVAYEFRLEAPGFDPLVRTFKFNKGEIPADGTPLIRRLILTKAKGAIRISSEPAGCEVYANGRYVGQTPLQVGDLNREREDLVLLLRRPGYTDHRQVLQWQSKILLTLDVVLKKEAKKSPRRRKRSR